MAHVHHAPCGVKPLLPPHLWHHNLPRLHPTRPTARHVSIHASYTAASRLAPTTAKHTSAHNTPSDQHPGHDHPSSLRSCPSCKSPIHHTHSRRSACLMFPAYPARPFSSPVNLRAAREAHSHRAWTARRMGWSTECTYPLISNGSNQVHTPLPVHHPVGRLHGAQHTRHRITTARGHA